MVPAGHVDFDTGASPLPSVEEDARGVLSVGGSLLLLLGGVGAGEEDRARIEWENGLVASGSRERIAERAVVVAVAVAVLVGCDIDEGGDIRRGTAATREPEARCRHRRQIMALWMYVLREKCRALRKAKKGPLLCSRLGIAAGRESNLSSLKLSSCLQFVLGPLAHAGLEILFDGFDSYGGTWSDL